MTYGAPRIIARAATRNPNMCSIAPFPKSAAALGSLPKNQVNIEFSTESSEFFSKFRDLKGEREESVGSDKWKVEREERTRGFGDAGTRREARCRSDGVSG